MSIVLTPLDRLVTRADRALRTLAATPPKAGRDSPALTLQPRTLPAADAQRSARLMRVNHAGEVAAQALYEGQAWTARREATRASMQEAAREESDHLAWCAGRLRELGGRPSLVNPLWYAGSFAIGAAAGLAGDRISLGFLAETERQVVEHLDGHLQRLPEEDARSRAILEQMRVDEARHGATAEQAGGAALPNGLRALMRVVSGIMTRTAYWI